MLRMHPTQKTAEKSIHVHRTWQVALRFTTVFCTAAARYRFPPPLPLDNLPLKKESHLKYKLFIKRKPKVANLVNSYLLVTATLHPMSF